MGDDSHNGEMTASGKYTRPETDKDLGHCDQANMGVGLTEGNEQGCSKQENGDSCHGCPFEFSSDSDKPDSVSNLENSGTIKVSYRPNMGLNMNEVREIAETT